MYLLKYLSCLYFICSKYNSTKCSTKISNPRPSGLNAHIISLRFYDGYVKVHYVIAIAYEMLSNCLAIASIITVHSLGLIQEPLWKKLLTIRQCFNVNSFELPWSCRWSVFVRCDCLRFVFCFRFFVDVVMFTYAFVNRFIFINYL